MRRLGLAAALVALAGCAAAAREPQGGAPSQPVAAAPAPTAASAGDGFAKGAAVYGAQCAVCHGPSLGGGVHAPALVGDAFMNGWGGKPARELYSRIISTMPLSDPGTLTEEEAAEVTAFILNNNGVRLSNKSAETPGDFSDVTINKH